MDSRRHFLRGLARVAAGVGGAATPAEPLVTPDPAAAEASEAAGAVAPVSGARYTAPLADPEWGAEGQAAVARSAVLVIGAGALGTPVLGYLAGAGVGRLGVLDDADVALSDLWAETVHYTPDVGVPKAHSAAAKLGFLNPEIVVEPYQVRFESANAAGLLAGQDLVVDCSGDEATRALVAASCARLGVALVAAGAGGSGGWVLSVPAGEHACPACAGVAPTGTPAGVVAGVVGSLQAREVLTRLAAGDPAPPAGALHVDLEAPSLRRGVLRRRSGCRRCDWR